MSTLQALLLPSDFIGLCNLFLLYIAYSTLGWCGEMLYCSIPKGHLCERGTCAKREVFSTVFSAPSTATAHCSCSTVCTAALKTRC